MKLSETQKELLSDKLLDLANLLAGAAIIGQILSDNFNLYVLIISSMFVVVIYIYSIRLRR